MNNVQASWGVFDRDNTLRRAISDSLQEAGHVFYPRWKEWEMRQAQVKMPHNLISTHNCKQELDFTLAESQWAEEWAALLALASQPGEALEQLHVRRRQYHRLIYLCKFFYYICAFNYVPSDSDSESSSVFRFLAASCFLKLSLQTFDNLRLRHTSPGKWDYKHQFYHNEHTHFCC